MNYCQSDRLPHPIAPNTIRTVLQLTASNVRHTEQLIQRRIFGRNEFTVLTACSASVTPLLTEIEYFVKVLLNTPRKSSGWTVLNERENRVLIAQSGLNIHCV